MAAHKIISHRLGGLSPMLTVGFVLLVFPAGHARHFFGNHLHNGGAFSCREIENGKFAAPTPFPKVDAMRGLFVCDVSFSDVPAQDRRCAIEWVCHRRGDGIVSTRIARQCTSPRLRHRVFFVEFSRFPLNIHCEGPCIGVVQSAL